MILVSLSRCHIFLSFAFHFDRWKKKKERRKTEGKANPKCNGAMQCMGKSKRDLPMMKIVSGAYVQRIWQCTGIHTHTHAHTQSFGKILKLIGIGINLLCARLIIVTSSSSVGYINGISSNRGVEIIRACNSKERKKKKERKKHGHA